MVRTLLMSRAATSSSELSSSRARSSGWKRGQVAQRGGEDGHGGGVGLDVLELVLLAFVQQLVARQAEAELVEFLLAGQATEDQQPGDLDEIGVLGELLDGNAAIAENALVAVDEGDSALADPAIAQRGVVGNQAGLVAEAGDVDGPLALGAHEDG